MKDLLEIFLALARQSQTENGMTDEVTPVLERALEVWKPEAKKKGFSLALRSEGKVPGAYSPVLLGGVVTNLVKNAVTYTGTRRSSDYGNGRRLLGAGYGTGHFRRGAGADLREVLPRGILRGPRGLGRGSLGRKRIADRCGWRVNLESSQKGTCFTVTLTGAKVKRMDERG